MPDEVRLNNFTLRIPKKYPTEKFLIDHFTEKFDSISLQLRKYIEFIKKTRPTF